MGEFITRGIAIGFGIGCTAALIARRYPMTRRHPNLIGFAVAGTADAISRDYRRPGIYERLLRLDAPLGERARAFLFSIRTGTEEFPTEVKSANQAWEGKMPPTAKDDSSHTDFDWWGSSDASAQIETDDVQEKTNAEKRSFGYPPVELPAGGPFRGTRTWDDIRRQQQEKGDSKD